MHDMSVAQMVVDEVTSRLREKRIKKIEIEMEAGSLRFHDTTQVEFWIRELLRQEFGKNLKVSVKIAKVEPRIKCGCGYRGAVDEEENDHELMHQGIFTMKCPKCSSEDYEIVQGNDVVLKKINVTE